jgi:uncharacterized protein YbjT (DUF2867 family)
MYVIAGATGRSGQAAARTLLAGKHRVRGIVRDAAKAEALRAAGAEIVVASLQDGEALASALDGARGLYAVLPEDPSQPEFHAHRRRMADALAAAVRASGVPHVVFLSAPAAAVADGNGPAKDLHYAEAGLRATGAKLTVISACYLQENVLAALPAARHEGIYPSFFPSVEVAFPTVATRDVGRLAARCLLEPPAKDEIIDLQGPLYSTRQMAEALGRSLGRDLRVVDIPAAAHVEALGKAGLPPEVAAAFAELFGFLAAFMASGRSSVRGERTERGTTTLDEMLRAALGG